jgi:TonB family protein
MLILLAGRLFPYLFRHKGAPLRSAISLMTMLVLITLPVLSPTLDDWGLVPFHASLPVTIGASGGSASTSIQISTEMPAEGSPRGTEARRWKYGIPYLESFLSGPILVKVVNLLGLIWGLGCAALGLRFVFGLLAVCGMKRDSFPVDDPRIPAILESAEKTFGKSIRTKILASPHIDGPMAVGFFRPVILLPVDLLAGLRDSDVRSILFHELSHILHWDQLTGIVQRLMTGLVWWNPLAYGLSSAFSRAREEISDTHVLLVNDSEEYAECLINLAEHSSFIRRLPVVIAMASPHIPLKDRVKTILSKERTMETHLNKPAMLVIALAAFLLVGGIAGYRLTFAAPEEAALAETLVVEPARVHDLPGVQDKDVKKPKLIRRVDPVYPDEAKKSGIAGTVAVEAVIDTKGDIVEAKIIRSAHKLLDQAALEAARKWKYEPMEIDGLPARAMMTVVFRFNLKDNQPAVTSKYAESDEQGKKAPIRAIGAIKPPKLIKLVQPLYPDKAKKAGIQGVVIVEATTDIYGRVKEVKVLRSIPALDQAAIDAVKQWVYEPKIVNGEPREVIFTATVRFQKDEKKDEGSLVARGMISSVVEGGSSKPPVRAENDIKPPKQLKIVRPVYPEEAKKAGIEGVVILEATTDIYGRVKRVKVLRSIPALDQAAIDAVYQWVYEPVIVNGEPREVIFTVTVRFQKDEKKDQ